MSVAQAQPASAGGTPPDAHVPTRAAVPATCWGGAEHTLQVVCLSNCDKGCNVHVCICCKKRFVLHNIMYGCRR